MKQKSIFTLEEIFEGTDGIKSSFIIAASFDKTKLQTKMKDLIKEDETGLIAKNGIDELTEDTLITNFKDGYIEYNINSTRYMS